ncbi:MAG: hypothetical protein ACLQPH_09260 [Acidimicrobiales bacterium]
MTDGSGEPDEQVMDAAPPPPPPPARAVADYAASAAMVNDILSAAPDAEEDRTPDRRPAGPATDGSGPTPPEEITGAVTDEVRGEVVAPLAGDFFQHPRPKRRFWRTK